MDASLALIDAVKQHGKVTCQVIGLAASGAFGVLQACKVRVMGALARLVTHEPAIIYPMPMDQHDLADLYSKVLKNTQTWNDVCSHRLKISRYEYDQKVKGGSWVMEASEALKVGAVDQIM